MGDLWEFRDVSLDPNHATYADGTVVPGLDADVYLNGKKVGEINAHMHRRRGRDGKTDTSFGFTGIVFSPPTGGN